MRKFYVLAVFALTAITAVAQTPAAAFRPARLPDGKPNMNGIWQALNTANWNLEDHASHESPVVATGALMAEPGGPGVVEGVEIPYLAAAKAKRD